MQDRVYVPVQEGIFYRDDLPAKDVQTVVRYAKKDSPTGLFRERIANWSSSQGPNFWNESSGTRCALGR